MVEVPGDKMMLEVSVTVLNWVVGRRLEKVTFGLRREPDD